MKKLSQKLSAICLSATLLASVGTAAFAADFTDMPPDGDWAHEALQAAVDNGLLKGSEDMIRPNGVLQRSELATVVNRAFGAVQTADLSAFNDVAQDAWYYLEMAKAVKMQTFLGNGSALNPESAITRQEAFAVLARALQLPAGDLNVLNQYTDADQIASSLKSECAAMVAAGYVKGSGGRLNPTGTMTRAEFAQVMYNAVQTYVTGTEPVTELAGGNVMVNVPNATLRNVTVKGDLVIGDGVGAGDFTMDAVQVEGRLVVRGGGANSIKITNGSSVSSIVVNKTADGGVRIAPDDSSSIVAVVISGGTDSVVVEGKVDTLTISGTAAVEIRGTVNKVDVQENAAGAKVQVAEGATVVDSLTVAGTAAVEIKGTVNKVDVQENAAGAKVQVAEGAIIKEMVSSAPNVEVFGEGTIEKATVSGNDTKFDVAGTELTVTEGTTGTTTGGAAVEGGSTVDTNTPADNGGSTGGGGGGADSGDDKPSVDYKANIDRLFAAYYQGIVQAANDAAPGGANISAEFDGVAGTLAIHYNPAVISTVGDVKNVVAGAYETAHLDLVLNMVKDMVENVNSMTALGQTLVIDDHTNLESVRTFMNNIFASSSFDNSTSTAPEVIGASVQVVVEAKNGVAYNYTIVNAPVTVE